MKQSYQKEEHCRDERKGSLRHFNLTEKIPSGYLFAEGCDRLVVVLIHPEYRLTGKTSSGVPYPRS